MLKAVIDELAKRFAASNVGVSGRHRLREKAEDLVLDLLAALETASLGEIAEATRALERRRRARESGRSAANGAGRSRKGGRYLESRAMDVENGSVAAAGAGEPAPARSRPRHGEAGDGPSRSPFDITMPNDLLDDPSSTALARAAARGARKESAPKETTELGELSVASAADGTLKPGVSLREGEELLRSGGSGTIIRRMRGS